MELQHLLQNFISQARDSDEIRVYNSASLRHELANFLQLQLEKESYGVQVGRKAEAVVLDAKEHDFLKAEIDVYVFQISGAGQYAVQVQVIDENDESSTADEIKRQLNFLQALKQHGFTQPHLLLAQKAPVDETGLQLLLTDNLHWQELQSTSQDVNGPWKCAVLAV